jgi:hypothetical protein
VNEARNMKKWPTKPLGEVVVLNPKKTAIAGLDDVLGVSFVPVPRQNKVVGFVVPTRAVATSNQPGETP